MRTWYCAWLAMAMSMKLFLTRIEKRRENQIWGKIQGSLGGVCSCCINNNKVPIVQDAGIEDGITEHF